MLPGALLHLANPLEIRLMFIKSRHDLRYPVGTIYLYIKSGHFKITVIPI